MGTRKNNLQALKSGDQKQFTAEAGCALQEAPKFLIKWINKNEIIIT